jgi:hypothetical protein
MSLVKKISLFIFLLFSILPTVISAEPHDNLKAVFVRDNDLWLKVEERERKITDKSYVRYPKWSYDGNWIAYLKGSREGNIFDLWLYHLKSDRHVKVKKNVAPNFQWSPTENTIGFQIVKDLFFINTRHPSQIIVAAKNIENFSWMPAGNGLLFSAKKENGLHSDIILSKVILSKNDKPAISHFYTVDVNENDFLVSTSEFKWSHDQKWISFLMIPTASLSADRNTLFVLSANGKNFYTVDEILSENTWFQWAPYNGLLGYVSGIGRDATVNKKFQVLKIPTFKNSVYTPKGFADRDFTWQNNRTVIVSRSMESGTGDLDQRAMPSLYKINLSRNKQSQLTYPAEKDGDFRPHIVKNTLFWIRTDRKSANVMVSPTYQMKEKVWIKNISMGSSYYEKWSWDEVFSLYAGRKR